MEISKEQERFMATGGMVLNDLPHDTLLCILKKLDVESLIRLGIADKQLRDVVLEESIWSDLCKRWEEAVDLVAWRAQMESGKALYRLLNSLSRLVGTWKHQSTDPRGELLYVTWGNLSVGAWKVDPPISGQVKFVKCFEVVSMRDGSHRVKLHRREESADIILRFPPPGNSFQLQLYHESDRVVTGNEVDAASSGQGLGKRLWSVARQYFGFSLSLTEDRRYVQNRVYNRLTYDELEPGKELSGLWYGFYGPHGCEVVTVSYTEDGLIVGKKVLGDVNVPAGVDTFKALISSESSRQLSGKFYLGQGRIAGESFMNPQWVDGVLVTLAGGGFLFHWIPLSSSVTFHRLELETLFKHQRDSEINRSMQDSDS